MTTFPRIGSLLTALTFVAAPALAVEKTTKTESKSHVTAKHETKKTEEGKEVTMTGKVVDLANYTTGMSCSDHSKWAECIRSGVPCCLETSKGIVLLGKGHKGCGEMLAEHASMEVKVKGRLYEKGGIKYMDIESVEKMGTAAAPVEKGKGLSSANDSHRNVHIYPPGELSKMQSKSAGSKTHTSSVAMSK